MKKFSTQKGIAPLILIIIAAMAVAGGAGTYQAVKKNNEKKVRENITASSTIDTSINATSTLDVKGNASIRSLIARNKDVMCTVSVTHASTTSDGTMYISGGMMRGDFTVKTANAATVESHMIQSGGMVYMWSGTQGVKMDSTASSNASANGQIQSSIDLDQMYSYDCKDWTKDASKFVAPTTVTFMDMSAVLKAQTQVQVPGVKVNANGTVKAGI